MNTMGGLKDLVRDDTRDRIYKTLQNMGISAQMAERGRSEEEVGLRPYFKSLGLIDIRESPISWINVIRKRITHITEYFLNYCMPDSRLSQVSPEVLFKTSHKRKFLVFGKISDLTWEGKDSDTGIINQLNSDSVLKEAVINSKVVYTVTSYGKGGYWIISSSYTELNVNPTRSPSEEEWYSCQLIAQHLLAD